MLKIGQNWGKIANYPPNAQQRSAPLYVEACFEILLGFRFFCWSLCIFLAHLLALNCFFFNFLRRSFLESKQLFLSSNRSVVEWIERLQLKR